MRKAKADYWDDLKAQATKGPLTAQTIGEIMHGYGPDCVTRLRGSRQVTIQVVGCVFPRRKGKPAVLYAVTFSKENQ